MENHIASHAVMTLDAGGTNFVFSAVKQQKEIVEPFILPSQGHDLEKCLQNIILGFETILRQMDEEPVAISFAFPGPADYTNGIIGDLGNLPGFRGGVALGPMLEEHFNLPVFINNDGDLFAYGEAMYGLLPEINHELQKAGSTRTYKNLIGITLGIGFGGGLVVNNQLHKGDNGAAAEIWLLRNPFNEKTFAEESISIRAITRLYGQAAEYDSPDLSSLNIYRIALGQESGNKDAAREAFRQFGKALGLALNEIVTILDGLVVIGGGIVNARKLFFPAMLQEMNATYKTAQGDNIPRLVMDVFDLQDQESLSQFAKADAAQIRVPFCERQVSYHSQKRIGVGVSRLGASKAITMGAYAFATNALGLPFQDKPYK